MPRLSSSANLIPRLEFLVQALVRRQRRCPHCGSESLATLARKYLLVKIRRCGDCGLAFTDPIYRSRLGPLYDRLYSGQGSTTALPDAARLRELRESIFASTDKDFRERVRRLRGVAPGTRLLEIGSSWGYFLFQAAKGGFEATGVELGRRRAEFGRRELGVRIVPDLDALRGERFDLVYTSHVLEHFTDLTRVFAQIHERLAPGGKLALEVPRVDPRPDDPDSLKRIGAVHPLGFDCEFFRRNLPRHGFRLEGFFDDWDDFPDRPVERSRRDNVICLAERAN